MLRNTVQLASPFSTYIHSGCLLYAYMKYMFVYSELSILADTGKEHNSKMFIILKMYPWI